MRIQWDQVQEIADHVLRLFHGLESHDREDLSQDIIVALLEKLDELNAAPDPEAFAHQMGRSFALDWLRRRKVRLQAVCEVAAWGRQKAREGKLLGKSVLDELIEKEEREGHGDVG